MALKDVLFYLAIGRLLTWLLQTNGLTRDLWQIHPKLEELSQCDLCLGFWVNLTILPQAPLRERVQLAALLSFLNHLIRLGWQSKFTITVIE